MHKTSDEKRTRQALQLLRILVENHPKQMTTRELADTFGRSWTYVDSLMQLLHSKRIVAPVSKLGGKTYERRVFWRVNEEVASRVLGGA